MRRILLAIQFLTIIPLVDPDRSDEKEIGSATAFFPLVGFIEGGVIAILSMLLLRFLPHDAVSLFVILFLIMINGGLHLDGLADTFDAIGVRGEKAKKLAIMKDGSTGPMGVVSIVITILANYILINAILHYVASPVYLEMLVSMPVVTRWAMVCAIYYSKPAREDGLGRFFIEHTGNREFIIATVMTFGFVSLTSVFSGLNLFLLFCIIIFPILYIVSIITVWGFSQQFGGLTGDSFGAINEIQRIVFLIIAVIWLQHYTS